MLKLPQHTLDHDPVLVSMLDPAWDRERIDKECEAMCEAAKEAGDKKWESAGEQHVCVLYARGDSRFDLLARGPTDGDDARALDYLTEGGYTRFVLERMTTTEIMRLQDEFTLNGVKNLRKVLEECARLGLADVEGLEGFELRRSGGRVTDDSMRVLYEAGEAGEAGGGVRLLAEIGNAVYAVSKAKTDAEKKR